MMNARADTARATERSNDPQLLRLFIALETNAAMQAALVAAQEALQRRGGSPLGSMPVRWVPPAQMHLTLQFLGNVVAAHVPALVEALHRAITPQRALLLCAGSVGAFPTNDAPRVLWLDVRAEVDALMALQRAISRAVQHVDDIVADRKPFRPHLTLGRVRHGERDRQGLDAIAAALARPVAIPAAAWPITEVALIRSVLGSGGPRYTVLERFPLHGGEAAHAGGPTF
jgi:2'-5' RNA ligase